MDCIKRVIYFTLYLLYVLKVNTGYPRFIHCIYFNNNRIHANFCCQQFGLLNPFLFCTNPCNASLPYELASSEGKLKTFSSQNLFITKFRPHNNCLQVLCMLRRCYNTQGNFSCNQRCN